MLSHLILFSVSLERQSNDYQISMNPEKKKSQGRSSITEFYLLAWVCNIWAGIITTPAQSAQYGKTEVIRYIHVLVYLFNTRKI